MQLRVEGVTTDLNVPSHFGPGAFYWDGRYRSGYTNNANIIGSWIGRRGRGEQGWLTYSLSPRNNIQVGYRNNNVDRGFLEGGHSQDITLGGNLCLRNDLELNGSVQYEKWRFLLLAATPQSDVTGTIGLTFHPHWKKR
jgi:hypothetical protein